MVILNSKAIERNWELCHCSFRYWKDRLVPIRKIMVQIFCGGLWTKSETIGEEKSKKEREEWFLHRPNNLVNFSTVHWPWQVRAFKTKLRSIKISLGLCVEHATKKHGSKQPTRGGGGTVNPDIMNPYVTKTLVQRTIFFSPIIVKCMEKDPYKTNPYCNEHFFPVPWHPVISGATALLYISQLSMCGAKGCAFWSSFGLTKA